ncbi:MAG: amidohydrolase family protein [Cyclobacteriaceae bacterium]
MRLITCLLIALLFQHSAFSQETFPTNGVQDKRVGLYAFTNGTVYKDYQTVIENATLVIDDGRVVQLGANNPVPKGAIVTDLGGRYIYPALVDIYSGYGLPKVERASFNFFGPQQLESNKEGAFAWNQTIRPETDATLEFEVDAHDAEHLRKAGFGAALSHVKDGIARGTSVLVSLADDDEQNVIIKERASAHYSFDRGSSTQLYPNSIMGSVALLRQTYYDAKWYQSSLNETLNNQSLDAFNDQQNLPQVFDASHNLNILLIAKIAKEFGKDYIIKGSGNEYQRINEIKITGASLIIPIDYPDAFDVNDPLVTLDISLTDMKHWELAPTNPATLEQSGINFAITSDGLKPDKFWKNLRKAVVYGLSESTALKSVTYTPASMVNANADVGSLNPGSLANFFISSDNIFNADSEILETWVQGRQTVVKDLNATDFGGKYDLQLDGTNLELEISGDPGSHKVKLKVNDTTDVSVKSKFEGQNIGMNFQRDDDDGPVRLHGWKDDKNLKGNGQLSDGSWITWTATFQEAVESKSKDKEPEEKPDDLGSVIYPFMAYGSEEIPSAKTYLIKNATVWTNESAGIVENTDVLVSDGKIASIGQDLSAAGAIEIDGTGKHLTTGIIDEHSHAALRGVNESSQASTAEVRMYDAVNSEDIDIYRQLAGGVTAAQMLHGSANPIGGQSALVKFRWGHNPDNLKIAGADGYIKFALGENVKHGNRPRVHNIRYPQTRMGVEQVFMDAFTRAKAYDEEWKKYNALSTKAKANTPTPRKDIELEALAEIINKERFISCHSYVQSEINMLMKVAEKFDFNVNTFTHILEGYKVADKMAEHGAGGSTFADWWAYKWEVKEAIPYGPALMNMVGVVTAINSDDAEMARRLNQEAAKSIKYADMGEEDAWKMVTLNPAKLLHLDDRMGSIKTGKDADLVLWNANPLSVYAKPEKTMVDGTIYFDLERDQQLKEYIQKERARLIAKMEAENGNGKGRKPKPEAPDDSHCEDEAISNDYSIYQH